MPQGQSLVSCTWLSDHLNAPDVKILDATSFMPDDPRTPESHFLEQHIPSACLFDINVIADTTTGLSHSMPKPEIFGSKVSQMGISDGVKVVIYDTHGGKNAAMRVWWMFRHFGHMDVAILDGGLPKWKSEGHPITKSNPTRLPLKDYRHFSPRKGIGHLMKAEQVLDASQKKSAAIIDARAADRYSGKTPEPRPCKQLGHIPESINMPHMQLFNEDMTVKSPTEIQDILTLAGVPLDDTPVIATCGTGVTACVIAFAAHLVGKHDVALYDGSWEEWGNLPHFPVKRGL